MNEIDYDEFDPSAYQDDSINDDQDDSCPCCSAQGCNFCLMLER